MARSKTKPNPQPQPSRSTGQYQVVARRYRPQRFEELVGQEHVAQALTNAITTGRIGHAYLFTGARGVGKTSTARIFAKALNCVEGPTPTPCNQCELCNSISQGEDVDVLEIDGASNRGIDEVRQLRQNASIRPTRARFKIYIIDEVHMLTREAFNALLKTLEEPPEHVKFIFCTTEPNKIPSTILSRCQRFDFAGIDTSAIIRRLQQITEAEGVRADAAALEVIARRANGSMRDAQSLLEQLLAFAPEKISVDDVHRMLGSAPDRLLGRLVTAVASKDGAECLRALDEACRAGVDLSVLLEQLCGFFRDALALSLGCDESVIAFTGQELLENAKQVAGALTTDTLLAAIQVLDQTLWRMRTSTHGRILAELAVVRLARLENLESVSELLARLESAGGQAGAERSPVPAEEASAPKRKPVVKPASAPLVAQRERTREDISTAEAAVAAEPSQGGDERLTSSGGDTTAAAELDAESIWQAAVGRLTGMLSTQCKLYSRAEFCPPNRLVVVFPGDAALSKSYCEKPDKLAQIEKAVSQAAGRRLKVEFQVTQGTASQTVVGNKRREMLRKVHANPLVREAGELFGAVPEEIEFPEEGSS